MDPARLIPAAEAIPSPWGWFEVLLWLTLAVHFLFMNLAVGSGVLALCCRGPEGRGLGRVLARRVPVFLALTVNFGVAPLLFVQVAYGQFLYTSSVLMAGWWLSAIPAVIAAYYAAYVRAARLNAPSPAGRNSGRWAAAFSLACLVYVGFLFSNNMTLMLRPAAWTAYFRNPNGSLLNLGDPSMWARAGHILLAAPAVAGLYAALLGERNDKPEWTARGLKWFTRVTMLELAAGLGVLLVQPGPVLSGLLGGSPRAAAFLGLGVAAGLLALAAGLRGRPRPAAGFLLAAVVLMTATRAQVRLLTLAPFFHPANLPVQEQGGALVMFLAALLAGLAVLAWMLRAYSRAVRRG